MLLLCKVLHTIQTMDMFSIQTTKRHYYFIPNTSICWSSSRLTFRFASISITAQPSSNQIEPLHLHTFRCIESVCFWDESIFIEHINVKNKTTSDLLIHAMKGSLCRINLKIRIHLLQFAHTTQWKLAYLINGTSHYYQSEFCNLL